MDIFFTEEQEMLRNSIKDMLEDESPRTLAREMEESEKGISLPLLQKMAGLGWTGIMIPESYGGSDGNFLDMAILFEQAGRFLAPVPLHPMLVCGQAILQVGSEEQKSKYLPLIAKGEATFAFAYSEPSDSWEPSAIQTSAVQSGDGFVINGTKLFVGNGCDADYIVCVARTGDSPKSLSLFIMDANSSGITRTALATTSMLCGEKLAEIVFDNAPVPITSLLGEINKAWTVIERVTDMDKTALAIEMAGGAKEAMEIATEYTKERVQFGRPIGSFQGLQFMISEAMTEVDGSWLIAYEAAWAISEGKPESTKLASMAKAYAGEVARRATDVACHLMGGYGMMMETDPQMYFRRAKAADLSLGDSEYQYELVAQGLGI